MDIKAIFFKETGKYYTEETIRIPAGMDQVYQVVDWLRDNCKTHKGMYLMAMLDEMPNGYPVLIPADQRA